MQLYDAVMVDLETNEVTIMGSGKTGANAEAICMMAVMRRGVDTHFYSPAIAGKYKDGDKWDGPGFNGEVEGGGFKPRGPRGLSAA